MTVFGISFDTVELQAQFAARENLDFRLLSDPERVAGGKYHAVRPGRGLPRRVTFVIDPAGILRHVFERVRVQTHGADVVREIRRLQKPADAPAPAVAANPIQVPEGFAATLVYEVPEAQGSWVSLTNADQGRLIASNQYGRLYRIAPDRTDPGARVEELQTDVGSAQGLLYAFGSLYVMGKQKRRSGLFRLTDTTGDDQFDKVEHLIEMPVGNEHQGHAIVPGPDGKSLYICGGNMTRFPKPDFTGSRMPRFFQGDHIIPRMPDARGHNTGGLPIGGWIARITPDAGERELIANGFRNEYDLAFSPAGELFTYDSDMEWDIGAAWYRPTRINHVVSGAEFGWRYGTGKWPAYYADSVGSVLDIGPGSPTGVVFGTGAKFPARYQRALFVGDWSYGVIYAVHLSPEGASFTGTKEAFATAAPLAVTDMVIRPEDGGLYFTMGGRRSRSSLYRIMYVGSEPTAAAAEVALPAAHAELHRLRHRLEALHRPGSPGAVEQAWPHLGHPDRSIRFAARIAVENQPVDGWRDRVFAETEPRRLVHAAIALARHGAPRLQTALLRRLAGIDWGGLGTDQRLELLRAYGLIFARWGRGGDGAVAEVVRQLDPGFPDRHRFVNRELCRVLCYLDVPGVVPRALALQAEAPSQEEQMHYAYCLRVVTRGWTREQRATYLKWFQRAAGYRGGASFAGFCKNIHQDAVQRMPEAERRALGDLTTAPKPAVVEPVARKFVKNWTVDELVPEVEKKNSGHDFNRGRRLFGEAACIRCHRFDGEGGAVGPDLTSVRGRFGVKEILESIIEPSKVISDQYQPTIFEMQNGEVYVGYVANLTGGTVKIVEDMFEPGRFRDLEVADIAAKKPSPVSMMPAGLISTLTAAEVQDLIAYMRSGGDPDHPLFHK